MAVHRQHQKVARDVRAGEKETMRKCEACGRKIPVAHESAQTLRGTWVCADTYACRDALRERVYELEARLALCGHLAHTEAVNRIRRRLGARKPDAAPNITPPFSVRRSLDGGAVICGREVRDGTDYNVPFAKSRAKTDHSGDIAEYLVHLANEGHRLVCLDEDDVVK